MVEMSQEEFGRGRDAAVPELARMMNNVGLGRGRRPGGDPNCSASTRASTDRAWDLVAARSLDRITIFRNPPWLSESRENVVGGWVTVVTR
jgi:hypothetical protein